MVTSKRVYSKGHLPGLLLLVSQSPQRATATVNPCLRRRASDISRWVWLSVLWGHCSFPLGPGVHKTLCQDWSLCKPCGQVPLACSQIPWGFLLPLLYPQAGTPAGGLRTSRHW